MTFGGGLDDHVLIADRLYADEIYRGLVEDYYFNNMSHGTFWGSPERLLLKMFNYYNIPLHVKKPCDFPFCTVYKKYENSRLMVDCHCRKLQGNKTLSGLDLAVLKNSTIHSVSKILASTLEIKSSEYDSYGKDRERDERNQTVSGNNYTVLLIDDKANETLELNKISTEI